jgi:hypothetical protein
MEYGGSWSKIAREHPGRHATSTCAPLRAAGLFIDSQSFVGDDIPLDLVMVEPQRLFQRRLGGVGFWRRPLAWASAGNLGIVLYIYSFGFSMQSFQDNCFLLVWLFSRLFTHVT